jgi:orotidine-5'-phosphate decarboxylase
MSNTPFIVAFDFADQQSATRLADQLSPQLCRAKVGKELFAACGMQVVDMLQNKGYEVFLDLKYHDIPNTVAKAVSVVADAGVWMVNVHASGGGRMMSAAKEALLKSNAKTKLIAVTVLTSMSQEDLHQLGIDRPLAEQVAFLAASSKAAGLDGVVCSAQEAALLRQQCGSDFLLVTPGIRPANNDGQVNADDQRRTLTPLQAMQAGSDYLVVGRPITQASDPLQVLNELVKTLSV